MKITGQNYKCTYIQNKKQMSYITTFGRSWWHPLFQQIPNQIERVYFFNKNVLKIILKNSLQRRYRSDGSYRVKRIAIHEGWTQINNRRRGITISTELTSSSLPTWARDMLKTYNNIRLDSNLSTTGTSSSHPPWLSAGDLTHC